MTDSQLPAMPTPEDVKAMFDRAAAAAQRAETAAAQLQAAQGAAADETRDRFPGMPAELVERVSKATAEQVVAALNANYDVGPPIPAGAPSAPAPDGAGSTAAPAADGAAGSASPASGQGDAAPAVDKPRNLAHRILGY